MLRKLRAVARDSMRNALFVLVLVLVFATATCALAAAEQLSTTSVSEGDVQIEIQSPSADFTATEGETTIEVEGIASAIGGVRYLDMMFVMDTSQSLRGTDPKDFRSTGAIGLVRNLSLKSDIKIGVISFNKKGELSQPLTSNRDSVIRVLRDLPRSGSTNLAAGIRTALEEFENNGVMGMTPSLG